MKQQLGVGIVGTGAMGTPMALRMNNAGHAVTSFSRSAKPELLEAGVAKVTTPSELAKAVSHILVMLPDLPQLEALLRGDDGLMAGDSDLLIMVGSTCSAIALRELSQSVHNETAGRVQLMDTPVSGGVEGATHGTLSIMAGGTPSQIREAQRVLEPCGRVHALGPVGAGQVAKACNQMVVAATMLALGEATVLAERSGIEPGALLEVLGGGYAGSTLLNAKRQKLIDDDYRPDGIAGYMLKDLGFSTAIAQDTGTNPALLPALVQAYTELVESGLGNEDLAVVRRFVAMRHL